MKHCAPTGGVSNAAARQATLRKQVPAAPAGRYGMSVVVHMDKLWLFGGTDGGYHQSDDDGYQHGEVLCSLMCSTKTAGSLPDCDGLRVVDVPAVRSKCLCSHYGPLQHALLSPQPGFEYGDLWNFDLRQHSWTRVQPRGTRPSARYLHSAVVIGDAMVVFGGFLEWQGDVWSFSFSSQRWTKLSEVSSVDDDVHVVC